MVIRWLTAVKEAEFWHWLQVFWDLWNWRNWFKMNMLLSSEVYQQMQANYMELFKTNICQFEERVGNQMYFYSTEMHRNELLKRSEHFLWFRRTQLADIWIKDDVGTYHNKTASKKCQKKQQHVRGVYLGIF